MRVRSEACTEAAPADLLQRAQGPEALGEPYRDVRPVGLDRDPGHTGRAQAVARRHPAKARGAREFALGRRSRERADGEDARRPQAVASFYARNVLNEARTSSVKILGCSHAAKWQPLGVRP